MTICCVCAEFRKVAGIAVEFIILIRTDCIKFLVPHIPVRTVNIPLSCAVETEFVFKDGFAVFFHGVIDKVEFGHEFNIVIENDSQSDICA